MINLLFIPLSKVDESKRMIYGIAANEAPDNDGEIFDYEASKPNIKAWSENAFKISGGKSYGNVRAMHNKVAAGRIDQEIGFNDEKKQVEVAIKIVDDNEWLKVTEGVYTGLSFGGSYGRKWSDPAQPMLKRYAAKPTELSLADLACGPEALFEVVKADGTSEMRKFSKAASKPAARATEEPVDMLTKIALLASKLSKLNALTKFAEVQKGEALKKTAALKTTIEAMLKAAATLSKTELQKGMYGVSSLANAISTIDMIARDSKFEAEIEGDESDIPGKLGDVRDSLGAILIEMATEEVSELNPNPEPEGDDMELTDAEKLAKAVGLLASIDANKMDKAAKASAKDHVQAIHDASVKLGATHNDLHNGEAGMSDGDGADEEDKEGDSEAEKVIKAGKRAERMAKLSKTNPALFRTMVEMQTLKADLAKLAALPANGTGPAATDAERLAKLAELNFQGAAPRQPTGAGSVVAESNSAEFLSMFKTAQANAKPVGDGGVQLKPGKDNLAKLAA